MKRKKRIFMWAGLIAIVCSLFFMPKELIYAEENARSFYEENGTELFFVPDGNANGNIYYAAAERHMHYTFRNLGWRFIVKDQDGEEIEGINYRLGNHVFPLVDDRYTDDRMVQYQLFRLNVKDMKRRMKPETVQQLEAGKCTITVAGCLVRRDSGRDDGALGEYGEVSGKVYFSYDEVEQSGLFSETEKEEAKLYYDREVVNLFCAIETEAGDGIKAITGSGNYCYGDRVKLTADVEEGWIFDGWSGASDARTKNISFRAKQSGSYRALAKCDNPPVILANDLYYPASYVKERRITEALLSAQARASDQEDGEIPYGDNGRNSFYFWDFSEEDFDSLKKGGSVTETLRAVDSGGNVTVKKIKVHIVDTDVRTGREAFGMPRLISRDYYMDTEGNPLGESEGGLPSDSCWVVYEDYRQLLKRVLGML